MRIAGLIVIAGCAATSPPATPRPRAHPCDPAHWSELVESRTRVWPSGAAAPATIVDVSGGFVEVASVTPSVIATRWVSHASLSPIAMRTTRVSSERGAEGEHAVRILAGRRLDPPSNGWAAVHDPDGFVPASVAGTTWTEEPPPDDRAAVAKMTVEELRRRPIVRSVTGDVRVMPDDSAPIRIALEKPTQTQLVAAAPNGYVTVTVRLAFAEIDGFWKPPPPEPPYDGPEIDTTPPAVHSPIAPGTCLYDAPHGRVVGMVRDVDAFARPQPAKVAGWYVATIPTIWGPSSYYIDTPPLDPPVPEREPEQTWNWGNEW